MSMNTTWILCLAGAYLCGSIPFGVIIGRLKGVDIREHGSRNIGATNVGRVLGKRLGVVCFVLDVLKGAAPVVVAGLALEALGRPIHSTIEQPGLTEPQMWRWLAVAAAAILGHMFSIFIGFKGGKGVATAFGTMAAMWQPLTFPALGAIVVWYAVVRITKYVSLASILAAASLPAGVLLMAIPNDGRDIPSHLGHALPLLIVTTLLAALVIYKHRANIARLRRGEEPKAGGGARRGDVLGKE